MKNKLKKLFVGALLLLALAGCTTQAGAKEILFDNTLLAPSQTTNFAQLLVDQPVTEETDEADEIASNITALDLLFETCLSDDELIKLQGQNLEIVKDTIYTIPDAIRFLDQYNCNYYSSATWDLNIQSFYNSFNNHSSVDGTYYNSLIAYFIEDDLSGLKCIVGNLVSPDSQDGIPVCWNLAGILVPLNSGNYRLISPSDDSTIRRNKNCNNNGFASITIKKDFSNLNKVVSTEINTGTTPKQLFVYNPTESIKFMSAGGNVTSVAGKVEYSCTISILETGSRNLDLVKANYNTYKLPNSCNPKLTENEIINTIKTSTTVDDVAKDLVTLGDVIYYFAINNYQAAGHDLTTHDESNDLYWHFNFSPEVCYEHNYGCCGTTAGLVAYLLAGDYDEVGICGMTFKEGEGGGHVINWIRDNNKYYVFDPVNLVSGEYRAAGFNFCSGNTLVSACNTWMNKSPWTEKCFYCYTSAEGDYPVGWGEIWGISYLPDYIKNVSTIILETPEEGYYYEFVSMSTKIINKINQIRNQK